MKIWIPNLSMQTVKGDLMGGISSGLVSIPSAVAFGVIAFSSLGEQYLGLGIVAGLLSAIVVGLIAPWFNSTRVMIYGPTGPTALVVSSMLAYFSTLEPINVGGEIDIALLLALLFFTVFLSGLMQFLFGLFRLGILVQYISSPVNTGILNGAVILIFLGQIGPVLGLDSLSFTNLFSDLGEIKLPTTLIALVTFFLMVNGHRITSHVPGAILGIVGGSLLYYSFLSLGLHSQLTGTVVAPPANIFENINIAGTLGIFKHDLFYENLPYILSQSFTIAVLAAVNTLLGAACLQNTIGKRPDGNKELLAQGMGVMAAGIVGGLPANGSLGRAKVNYSTGGRGALSSAMDAVTVLIFVLFFAPLIGYLPVAVTAGVVLGIGVLLADPWMTQLIMKLRSKEASRPKEILQNLGLMFSAMALTVFTDLITAVLAAVILSLVIFIIQMSRSSIHRVLRGPVSKSKKKRQEAAQELLDTYRDQIAIIELQGSLFFGSADKIANKIETLQKEGVRYIVLDFKRVMRLDSSTALVFGLIYDQIKAKRNSIIFSHVYLGSIIWEQLEDYDLLHKVEYGDVKYDIGEAIMAIEDRILEEHMGELERFDAIDFNSYMTKKGMRPELVNEFLKYVEKREYTPGEKITKVDNPRNAVYFLMEGEAMAVLPTDDPNNIRKRQHYYTPGTIFGEMALVEGSARTTDIIARTRCICYRLESESLFQMQYDNPQATIDVYKVLIRVLSKNLRRSLRSNSELDDYAIES